MATPEIKFNLTEQQIFDCAFPPSQVEAFEQDTSADDWVDAFVVLKAFGFPDIKPQGKSKVSKQLLTHRYGHSIIAHETESGLIVYRRNITPLLRASMDVIISCIDEWTEEQNGPIFSMFPAQVTIDNHREEDWRK